MKHLKRILLVIFICLTSCFFMAGCDSCAAFSSCYDWLKNLVNPSREVTIEAAPEEFDIWEGEVATSFQKGKGTKKSPYQISTADELAYFASLINSGDEEYCSDYYCLTKSIDLNGYEWTPIGTKLTLSLDSDGSYFSGSFDGNGCIIRNFKITKAKTQAVGFFNYVRRATIKNIGLTDFSISVTNSVTEKYRVGALVGCLDTESKLLNSYAQGDVMFTATTSDVSVGGLVGMNHGLSSIENCFFEGSVSARYVAKTIYGEGNMCSAYAGGLVADNYAFIKNSYAIADVTAYSSNDCCWAGGLVGINRYSSLNMVGGLSLPGTVKSEASIINCFSKGTVHASGYWELYVGGLIGINYYDVVGSFSLSDVICSLLSESGYVSAGRLIGSDENNSENSGVENSYCFVEQAISTNINGDSDKITFEICNLGQETSVSVLHNTNFFLNLGFDKVWILHEGNLPSLGGLPTVHTHNYTMRFDATQHWYECACGMKKKKYNHTYSEREYVSGCGENSGYYIKYCTGCGYLDAIASGTAHAHEYVYKDPVPATCTESGISVWIECKNCGFDVVKKYSSPLGHSYGEEHYYDGTGLNQCYYRYCQRAGCGKRSSVGHNYQWTTLSEATCLKMGLMKGVCMECGYETKQETYGEHNWTSWRTTKNPTCQEVGLEERNCKVCGVLDIRELSLAHNWSNWITYKQPTCHEEGIMRRKCSYCSRIEEKSLDPVHNWGGYRITQEATCEDTGVKIDTCLSCGETRTKSYGPLGHNWGGYQIIQEATCTATGMKRDTCLRCRETRTKSYGPIEHNWGGYRVTQEATCEGTGLKTDTCVSCGETRTMTYGPLGHNWGGYRVTQEATCENTGVQTDTCTRCGEMRTMPYGPLGHNWAGYRVTQEATCTTTGEKTDTCIRCGEIRTMPYGPIEHNWAGYKVTQEATCNGTGVKTDTCSSCGETRTQEYGPLGHSWGGYKVTQEATCENTGVQTDTCTRCGETRTKSYGPLGHNWKYSSKAATCTEAGYDITACVRCGEGEEKHYPELGHSLENKYNSASHWTACTRGGCGFKGTLQTHIMREDYDYQEIDDGSQIVYQFSLYNKCATCGYKEKIGESAMHKHYGTTIIPATATCDKAGYTAGLKCSVEGCGEIYIQPKEVAALGHLSVKYGAKEPTCIESGWDAYVTCMREGCSHTTYNEIPALGHRYVDGICTRCGLQNQTMHPHSYTKLQCDKTNHWYECACGEVKVGSIEAHFGGTATLSQQAVCVMCNMPYGDLAPYTKRSDGTIDFGSYPQTKVTDSSLIVTLNTMAGVFPTANNHYDWISYDYYNMGSKTTDYMWYQDVTYQDNKYRGVYFDQYRLIYTMGDSTANVQQSNGYTKGAIYWFKWEVLNWTILEEVDGRALLLCNSVIDSQEYYHDNENIRYINGREVFPNNYKESDMRQWLNSTFLRMAFEADQKAIIRTSSVINNTQSTNPYNNPNYWSNGENKYVCSTTNDSVFLLSEEEATNPNYKLHVEQTRGRKGTDYAFCQGLRSLGLYQCWWLRSPAHEYDSGVRGVGNDGKADLKFNVHRTDYGVVPAVRIALL